MQDILNLIQTAYTCTDNTIRMQAENNLFQKCQESVTSFQCLISIITSQSQYHEQACSFLNNIILKMYTSKTQISDTHIASVFSIIGTTNVPVKQKLMLNKALCQLIRMKEDIRTQVENQMKMSLKSENYEEINSGIILFKALIDSFDINSYTFVMPPLQNLTWISDFLTLSSQIAVHFVKNQVNITPELLFTTKLLLSVEFDFIEKVFKQQKSKIREPLIPLQNLIFQSVPFSGSLLAILQFSIQKGNQIQNCVISCSGDNVLDSQINELKMFALKIYFYILNVLLNQRNKSEQKKGVFQPQLMANIQLFIYSCFTYLNVVEVPNIMELPFQSEIFTYMLKIMADAGSQSELYQLFSDAKISLITDVIYPFLITSKSEYDNMKEQPEEFVALGLDTIDKQESDIPKTAAAKLLETLCDHIDGSTSFLAQLAILITQYSICEAQNLPSPLSDQEMTFITHIKDKKIFKNYTPIDRIESSLVLLTIMSYLVQKRNDIVNMMEKLLVENLQFFMNTNELIIKVRLALFFGYYCDNLFKLDAQAQNMLAYLRILIGFVQPDHPVLLYQAIDALKDVFEDEDLKSKTKPLVVNIFPSLCSGLSYSSYEKHVEMIANLLKTHPQIFSQNEQLIFGLIQVVIQRIQYEFTLIRQGDKQRFIYINRCWYILRVLPEIDEFVPLLLKIEEHLIPLYNMLITIGNVEFEEDIIQLVTQIIEKTQMVTVTEMQLLQSFSKIMKNQHDRLMSLFELLNFYMFYGKQQFYDENAQQLFFTLGFQTLISQEVYLTEIEQGEGALLIQLGIQILGDAISPNILQHILTQTLALLNKNGNQGYLKSRIAGIILSSLYTVPQLTYQILQQMFSQVLNEMMKVQYSIGYDIKLFIITMCSLIKKEHGFFNKDFIQVMVALLSQQHQQEKEVDMQNDDSFEDDSDDDFDEQEEKQQALIQMEQFKSQILKIDEYSEFKNMIYFIKQQYPQAMDQLRQNIDNITLQRFNDVLSCARIETGEGLDEPRKIITVKRKKVINKEQQQS